MSIMKLVFFLASVMLISYPSVTRVSCAPTSQATESCYRPISTSPSWFNESGSWANPCSPVSSAPPSFSPVNVDVQQRLARFFSRKLNLNRLRLAQDALATVREAAELADILQQQILEVNMHNAVALAEFLDDITFIEGIYDNTNTTDTAQKVQEEYSKLSVVLVYLEQCRHDEQPLCHTRLRDLLSFYDQLVTQILRALCKMKGLLDSFSAPTPTVLRSVMSEEDRNIHHVADVDDAETLRSCRDYVVLGDVRAVLRNAAKVLSESDWSSV